MFTLALATLHGIAHAACASPSTALDLSRQVSRGEAAFIDLDQGALEGAARDATALLACLQSPLARVEIAAYMRLIGFDSFVAADQDRARRYLTSARALDPGYALPLSMVDGSHPMRILFESITQPPIDPVALPLPESGWLQVDGVSAEVPEAPGGRPWVRQWLDPTGAVRETWVVTSTEAPPYPVAQPTPTPPRLSVAAGSAITWRSEGAEPGGSLGLAITAPLAGPVSLHGGVRTSLRTIPEGDGRRAYGLPVLQLGLRSDLGDPDRVVRPLAGLTGLGIFSVEPVFLPGAALEAGLQIGRRQALQIDLLAGFVGKIPLFAPTIGFSTPL